MNGSDEGMRRMPAQAVRGGRSERPRVVAYDPHFPVLVNDGDHPMAIRAFPPRRSWTEAHTRRTRS